MDESWRMRIGMPPRRRSTTEFTTLNDVASASFSRDKGPYSEISNPMATRRSTEEYSSSSSFLAGRRKLLDPEDFSDVFGGPPRTVLLSREYDQTPSPAPGEFPSFYREIFWTPETARKAAGGRGGRSLLAFRIPAERREGFYDDVFGVDEVAAGGRRSRERSRPGSKAKSNSSSVLSSEEISPPRRQVTGEDAVLSSVPSKLRPINVPCRWNSNTMMPDEPMKQQEMPSFPSYTEADRAENLRSSYFKVSRQVSSPEAISFEPTSYTSFKASADDLELLSPASPVSSLCQEPEGKARVNCNMTREEERELEEEEDDDDDDEVMSSYVIEINSNHREGTAEAASIDEAIAWAKEKFQGYSSDAQSPENRSADIEETPTAQECAGLQMAGFGGMQSTRTETELLDGDVRSWSAGKETNIRLLLSALHHILLPSSGWYEVPLTSLIESSHVKRAYQRARLCLHPDKMQQRGATFQQKYIAEKAFLILQDAWAAFVSEDVLFN